MATKADLMVQNARALIGNGYAWGSSGQICTQALLDKLAKQYPAQTNLLTVCPKWIGKRIYDCATFVRACLRAAGIEICSGASSQWRGDYWQDKGVAADMPMDKPCILYNASANANPMGHTGIYLGDGNVIDCRGSREGVMLSPLTSRQWSHYAVPRGLYDAIDLLTGTVQAATGNWVRMRRFASADAGTVLKVPLGATLTVTERGSEWCAVMDSTGHSGYMMTQFLSVGGADDATYTVQLLDATAAEKDALRAACERVTVETNVG